MSLTEPPKISVIIPHYNPNSHFFKDSIQSILVQSYTNWEAIIVNDGSPQKSTKFLEDFIKSLDDKRFKIISHKTNQGVASAKKTGVENSIGEIIVFLDTDDFHFPWYYNEINDHFSNNPECLILATSSYQHITTKKRKVFF